MDTTTILLIVFFYCLYLLVPTISLIVWYSTKNPNNKVLKILYWVRWYVPILETFITLKDLYNYIFNIYISPGQVSLAQNTAAQNMGYMLGYCLIVWLYTKRWVKNNEIKDDSN